MTAYNESISYDAPIPYNGVVTPPPTPSIAGYGGGQIYNYVPVLFPEDDEIIAIMLLELLDD